MPKEVCLHGYQREIVSRLAEAWRTHRSVMVQMPTGTGKTLVLAAVVNEELRVKNEESFGNEELRIKNEESRAETEGRANEESGGVFIIAHRRELVAQIEETVGKMLAANYNRQTSLEQTPDSLSDFPSVSAPDSSFFTLHSSFPKDSSFFTLHSSFIRVLSIQWLSRHWDDVKDTPGLVIIDEAHHAVAETYKEMWNRWPKARFLGLTATPCRMNHRGFTDLFDTLITSWGVAEFIERGYLSAFDYVSIRPGSEAQRLIDTLEKRGADGDYQVKEMNAVLNRNASIARLYRSMKQFAGGKKGIVYAISIAHARNIAAYYNKKGVRAEAIDSRTPAAERRRLVADFRAGRIQVLVNVDIFSEGFDCPDVEFVQLARPTLSLAKYLQQVGRGLRKSEGKASCVLIDNVGLYRVFGLPTVAWDWQAMFRGSVPGRAARPLHMRSSDGMTAIHEAPAAPQDCGMEVIVSHERLLADIGRLKDARPLRADDGELKSWHDAESGLWGLRRGRERTADAVFVAVFNIRYDMAAVSFKDKDCGIVNAAGDILWKQGGCRSVRILRDRLLLVAGRSSDCYVDIHSLRAYTRKPNVRKYGNVELLEVDHRYYSRTRTVYVSSRGLDRRLIRWRKFYLTIYDERVAYPGCRAGKMPSEYNTGHACILEGDSESYYWLHRCLADGSIIIADDGGRFYHAAEGTPKVYIGCCCSEEEWGRCRAEIERMKIQAEEELRVSESKRAERRREILARSDCAIPFSSGTRWGLKVAGRVIVPPIYRTVRCPVGMYCAVERNYGQWGIISIDGTVMVEPRYTDVSIDGNGTARLTYVTGETVSVKLS